VRIGEFSYIDSLKDGGLARRMTGVGHPAVKNVEFHATGNESSKALSSNEVSQLWADFKGAKTNVPRPIEVPLSCHCGTIQLRITSPDDKRSQADATLIERCTRENRTKYVARICVCRSDRLWFGAPITVWTYVFPENILTATGSTIDFSFDRSLTPELPGLKTYASSADARRSFCGTCGAGIFYEHKHRPWVMNVMPGLLRAESGNMVEELLSWEWERVIWAEENQNREYLDMLTGGESVVG